MEKYFEEYFHPTQDVNVFLKEMQFDNDVPKQRTLTRLNIARERLLSRNLDEDVELRAQSVNDEN